MPGRRDFLTGLLAASLAPRPSWADVGAPAYLTAGAAGPDAFVLCGLDVAGEILFRVPLPARGHAAAAHPERPEAVAFARRPGTFALVLDCRTGNVLSRLDAPPGRHFYGHGTFSADGSILYTGENAYDEGDGRIGLWLASNGYRRLGEIPSGGVGPHDVMRLPGHDDLVIANGGIETHPDSGRAKLNLPVMRPNLSYLSPEGALLEQVEPPGEWHMNSIRHLAARPDGTVAAAMQWQGDPADAPPLLLLHRRGEAARYLGFDDPDHRRLQGYGGSVAFSGGGDLVAISSPRGGDVQVFDTKRARPAFREALADACGLAPAADGLAVTSGAGVIAYLGADPGAERLAVQRRHPLRWDNHLIALT